jgi:hypothetical protein
MKEALLWLRGDGQIYEYLLGFGESLSISRPGKVGGLVDNH